MFKFISAAAFVMAAATSVSASTVDLSDGNFVPGSVTYSTVNPINGFAELSDSVTFTFATSGQFRSIGTWNTGIIDPANPVLAIGGGGLSTTSFTISVDQDVTLDAFTGFDARYLVNAVFDVTGAGVSSLGNGFSTVGSLSIDTPVSESFVGGPLNLSAGESYTFSITNPSATTQSFIFGLEFTKADVEVVPLPAGLSLLLGALGLLGLVRRRSAA